MSPDVPEQDLGSSSLYVPLRTEEVGWEEGGLIWAPKRYYYPTVNLYGGANDHVIGQYRGGPKGYRFINITDPAFALAQADDDEVKSAPPAPSTKSRGRSQMPKGPIAVATSSNATSKQDYASTSIASSHQPTSLPASPVSLCIDESSMSSDSASSSASSSRQGSFSTDDGHSSGADTGMTTPTAEVESPTVDESESMSDKLQAALSALKDQEGSDSGSNTQKLASRTKAGAIASDPVDASRLAGPFKAKLNSNPLGHDRTLTLSSTVPEQHFSTYAGRSTSKLSLLDYLVTDDTAGEFAAGWAYEQNTHVQYSAMQPIEEEADEEMGLQDVAMSVAG